MKKRGTIADLTKWAERTRPGEEPRARSVIVGCRKAGLFTKGGHGRNAPLMTLTDFPTAILAVLHPGLVTKVAEAVADYWGLNLNLIELDSRDEGQAEYDPCEDGFRHNVKTLSPFFGHFNLSLSSLREPGTDNLIGNLTDLYTSHAPENAFHGADHIEMEVTGSNTVVRIVLHGPTYFTYRNGWAEADPNAFRLTLTYGDFAGFDRRAISTKTRIYGDALNTLALMAPHQRGCD